MFFFPRKIFPKLIGRKSTRSGQQSNPYVKETWTRNFCCVVGTKLTTIPTNNMVRLMQVGCGKKKVIFHGYDSHEIS